MPGLIDPFIAKAQRYADNLPVYPYLNQVNKPAMLHLLAEFGRSCWEDGYQQGLRESNEEDD